MLLLCSLLFFPFASKLTSLTMFWLQKLLTLNEKVINNYSSFNWVSEASPTLGCSLEISIDIYMSVCRYVGMYVGLSTKNMYAKMRGRNYVAQTHTCSKSVLGS